VLDRLPALGSAVRTLLSHISLKTEKAIASLRTGEAPTPGSGLQVALHVSGERCESVLHEKGSQGPSEWEVGFPAGKVREKRSGWLPPGPARDFIVM